MNKLRRLITKRACVRLTLLITLLVGGAIVNVAVAWACAEWCPSGVSSRLFFFDIGVDRGTVNARMAVSERAGWPLRSMSWAPETWGQNYQERFPTRIVIGEFVFNTAFFAFVLWLLFAAPFALRGVRRRLRVKRGLCVKCAYDLRGRAPASEVCPECGTGTTPTP